MTTHSFQTEVSQLLHLIIHSLYSHKEIFLRELVSNSSDALDKLKYLTLTDDAHKDAAFEPKIDISYQDGDAKTLTISDSGIGMNEEDLKENLGTIARSGTKNFLNKLTGDAKKDSSLIGQFGVGFYSSYMVADSVEVISRKAGEDDAWKWTSDGKSGYEIEKTVRKSAGTDVILHLNDEGKEYVNRWEIQTIIKKYSNHIPFPIHLHYEDTQYDKDGKETGKEQKEDQINDGTAFWKRSKSELKEKDYNEFYKSISTDFEDPMLYFHTRAEGALEYTTLFYIPKKAPTDLFYADYKPGVKLYVNRVFITDDDKELMPVWMRFLRGVIDSEDLPLNISREILQQNRIMAKIKKNSVKKLIKEFGNLANTDSKKYIEFYEEYGRTLKEGVAQDFENKDNLIDLLRFKSTKVDGYTSLAEYLDRMQDDQNIIYYITGEKEGSLRNSPLLEMYNNKDVEVLIMDDEIDELVMPSIPKYKEKELRSVNRSDAADELKSDDEKSSEKELKPLLKKIKKVLGDKVKDVVASTRLSDSPSVIVADQNDPTVQMQEVLRAMGQTAPQDVKPILEINPTHAVVKKMQDMRKSKAFDDAAMLLLEQALLLEGVKLDNPPEFVSRLNSILGKAL
ncbi:MAG: molecular chaperone HtpG [Candidatus Marinimicrobia bacterium]|nr:molecular chaperone HtpG [Candidatus Neomarinimicrobiota bacterium]